MQNYLSSMLTVDFEKEISAISAVLCKVNAIPARRVNESLTVSKGSTGCVLFGLEEGEEAIPKPTQLNNVKTEPNGSVVLVEA